MSAGQTILGAFVSCTTTAKLQPAVLPEASVAVQLTVFVPFANGEPLEGVQITPTPGQLSVAAGTNVTMAVHWPGSVLLTMLAGQTSAGFSVSLTTTEKLQPVALPDASVAVQLTELVPFAKVEPEGGVQTNVVPGQLSPVVVVKFTTALH
jgi:hypothetical protein